MEKFFYQGEILTKSKIKKYRGEQIAFIPQSVNYLDPSMKVKDQVKIGLKHEKKWKKEKYKKKYLNSSN